MRAYFVAAGDELLAGADSLTSSLGCPFYLKEILYDRKISLLQIKNLTNGHYVVIIFNNSFCRKILSTNIKLIIEMTCIDLRIE